MSSRFISRLPRGAEGKAFRVLAPEGGYGASVAELQRRLEHEDQATFELTAQRDYEDILVKVTVKRGTISPNGVSLRFDGAIGELLDSYGRPTGRVYQLVLSINPSIPQAGETVGVLRMKRAARLSTAC